MNLLLQGIPKLSSALGMGLQSWHMDDDERNGVTKDDNSIPLINGVNGPDFVVEVGEQWRDEDDTSRLRSRKDGGPSEGAGGDEQAEGSHRWVSTVRCLPEVQDTFQKVQTHAERRERGRQLIADCS